MSESVLFWRKVDKRPFGCWVWTAWKNSKGYGNFNIGERKWKAHRLSYTFFYGPIPDGLLVLHRCDNPSCVNPDHLFLGTARDNFQDAISKKRLPFTTQTHCKNGHEFSAENT